MSAVTYPEASVADTVERQFVPLQVNVQEPVSKQVIERYRQFWTPDVRLLDWEGFDLYDWQGYLPPYEFLPQLFVGRGYACLRLGEPSGATAIFDEVVRRFPAARFVPEAQYYLVVARYKASHQADDPSTGWRRLQDRYPASLWRVKQAFIEQPAEAEHQSARAPRKAA
jgi:hypothetical protein